MPEITKEEYRQLRVAEKKLREKYHKTKKELNHYKKRCQELEMVIKHLELDDMR